MKNQKLENGKCSIELIKKYNIGKFIYIVKQKYKIENYLQNLFSIKSLKMKNKNVKLCINNLQIKILL